MDGKDPFGYPGITYVWVLGLACLGGLVKYLNSMNNFKFGRLIIDVISSGFTGLMTFWMCEFLNISGSLSAVLIATAGLMGNRAWKEFENIWLARIGGRAPASDNPDTTEKK